MPYPNDNKFNVIIAQTSASADLTGKFPFTERIISGSNLIVLTDESGFLTGSNTLPNLTITNLTVTTLTASIISASTALTSAAATFTGPVSMSSTLSASGIYDSGILTVIGVTNLTNVTASGNMLFSGSPSYLNGANLVISASGANFTGNLGSNTLTVTSSIVDGGTLTVLGNTFLGDTITDAVKVTGSVSISGSLSVVGPIIGTIETASKVVVTNIPNTNATYYVAFVENTGSAQSILTDSNVLSYNTLLNRVIVGNTSGSLFISNDVGTNPNGIALYNDNDNSGATIQVGQPSQNQTSSLYVGHQSNGFRVLTGQGANTGVITELPVSASNKILFSNTTNATSWTNGGALTVNGGVGIGKDLHVSGSTFLYGDLTIYGSSSIVNISSSTIIIGDNRILLNAASPIMRYAGIDVYDSGSGGIQSNVTSSFVWDSLTDNWIIFSANSGSGTYTTASSILIGGPTSKFGNESLLTVNSIPKVQSSGKNLTSSLLIENGNTLSYAGNISASQITASNAWIVNLSSSFITASDATFADVYSTFISSSQLTSSNGLILNLSSSVISASNATIVNLYSTKISSSQITASDAFIINLGGLDNLSSSRITASNGLITNIFSTNISSSRITASNALLTNVYSNYISSSVISSSNLRVELTGSITYATGVLVTYITGSFNTLTLSTGSFPGNAPGLVPNTPTSSGMPGQINVDNNFIYVYTNQVWKRVPLSQWFN